MSVAEARTVSGGWDTIRIAIASLASLIAGYLLFREIVEAGGVHEGRQAALAAALIGAPVLAAGLIWNRQVVAQLAARAVWWSFFVVGAAGIVLSTIRDELVLAGEMAALTGLALVAAATLGLRGAEARFQPVAFRAALLVSLVLAMADAGAFTWFGFGNYVFDSRPSVLLVVPPMVAGAIGLFRLRTWGLIVIMATNLLTAILLTLEVLYVPGAIRTVFVVTALVQLAVPVPMLVHIVRRRR